MTKGKLSLIGFTAVILTLSACVTELWKVTYPAPEGRYSGALDVTLNRSRQPILFGTTYNPNTKDQSIFVAKYNRVGGQIWDYESPNLRMGSFPGNNQFIATDADGNVYFAGYGLDQSITFTKLTYFGELAWETTIPTDLNFPLDIKVVNNQMVLLLKTPGSGGDWVYAYSLNGEKLWTLSASASCSGGCATELEGSPESVSPPPLFSKSELAVLNDNAIFVNSGSSIIRLDTQGNVIAEVAADSLGANSLVDMAHNGNQLAVLGESGDAAELLTLNTDLEVLDRYAVEIELGNFTLLDINQDNHICLTTLNQDFLEVTAVGSDTLWVQREKAEFIFEGITGLSVSEQGRCYVSTIERKTAEPSEGGSVDNQWLSKTRVYAASGKLTDSFGDLHFVSHSVRVKDDYVYSAGQSGIYADGEYQSGSDVATLYWHQVR